MFVLSVGENQSVLNELLLLLLTTSAFTTSAAVF